MGYYCFTKTNLYHVYCYEMCLAWIQVILWRSMLMYKISSFLPRSTHSTILWVMVRGNSDCCILDKIACACCAPIPLTTNLLVAPEGFRYSGNVVSVRPTDAREPVPPHDPPDQ